VWGSLLDKKNATISRRLVNQVFSYPAIVQGVEYSKYKDTVLHTVSTHEGLLVERGMFNHRPMRRCKGKPSEISK
jgi:hypothetical protein